MPPPPGALIIDDEEGVRASLRLILGTLGYDPDTASDPVEALARFSPGRHQLVCVDVKLTGHAHTGWDLASAIREQAPSVAIVIITGADTEDVLRRARAAGWPLLVKPFSVADVRAAIEHARPARPANE